VSAYEAHYDPKKVLAHPEFRVLAADDPLLLKRDESKNVACAYNEKHECHHILKPTPELAEGEVLVHVRATGICG
jgi:L-iditol 2-dehydrogenase